MSSLSASMSCGRGATNSSGLTSVKNAVRTRARPASPRRITKRGSAPVRHVLVGVAWVAARAPGPVRAFSERTRAHRGAEVVVLAAARNVTVLSWCLLTREQGYAYARSSHPESVVIGVVVLHARGLAVGEPSELDGAEAPLLAAT